MSELDQTIEELEAEVYSDPTSYVEPNGKSVTYADQEEM